MSDGVLDEAYERLHRTGPEYRGLALQPRTDGRRGVGPTRAPHTGCTAGSTTTSAASTSCPAGCARSTTGGRRWATRSGPATGWPTSTDELREHPWREVLGTWWPRLLPGIAAGATHGVIRVGHAVRALEHGDENRQRLTELGQALGYWAARWQPVPGTDQLLAGETDRSDTDDLDVAAALAGLPRIDDQTGASGSGWAGCRAYPDGSRRCGAAARAEPGRGGARADRRWCTGRAWTTCASGTPQPGHAGARGDRADRGAAYPAGTATGRCGRRASPRPGPRRRP